MKSDSSNINKFKQEDDKYLTDRKLVAEKVVFNNLFDIADHFGLYSGIQTIGRGLAVYELIKQTLAIPGNVFEFGCWKGSNLLLMAKILKLLQPNTIKEVYGFDSFEGLQTISREDQLDKGVRGSYKGNEETLKNFIKLYGLEGWVRLIKGDANKTIKIFEKKNPHILISLAYIDFDLYLPTKEALRFIHKRLSVGGLIVFDEAMTHEWQGEGKAMLEFLQEHEGKYETGIIPFVRQPTVFLKRR
jgi:hypothetical protein